MLNNLISDYERVSKILRVDNAINKQVINLLNHITDNAYCFNIDYIKNLTKNPNLNTLTDANILCQSNILGLKKLTKMLDNIKDHYSPEGETELITNDLINLASILISHQQSTSATINNEIARIKLAIDSLNDNQ